MKKTMLCKSVLVIILCTSSLYAQDSLSVIGKFIGGHSWTMDFGISSNLTLNNFKGAAISLSDFISDYQKYRLEVSTAFSNSSGDQSGNQYSADTLSNNSSGNSDYNSNSIQMTLQYITYATPKAQTSIYFGVGPFVGLSWSKNNSNSSSTSVDFSQSQSSSTSSSSSYFVGVLGSIGVEWFFSEHISLHAEYGLSAQYNWGSSQSNSNNQVTYNSIYSYTSNSYRSNSSNTSKGWSVAGQTVVFGLSVNY
jgi:hypothetical protein